MDIYEELVRLKKEGRPAALATIVQCIGSSPQKEGAKMLVRDDGTISGTLGGGCLEAEVVHDFGTVFEAVPVGDSTSVVIATRGHNHNLDALKAALKTKAPYIGLLGSKRKKAVLFRTLESEGVPEADIRRIITPVGVPIGSVSPEEIAVSIMAQVIQHRRRQSNENTPHTSHTSCGRFVQEDGGDKATAADC